MHTNKVIKNTFYEANVCKRQVRAPLCWCWCIVVVGDWITGADARGSHVDLERILVEVSLES